MKVFLNVIFATVFTLLFVNLSFVHAQEDIAINLITGNQIYINGRLVAPGITPDNFLYPLDVAFDKLSLYLTFEPKSKAFRALEIARERLLEVREMIIKNNLKDAEKARSEHINMMREVENSLMSLRKDNLINELSDLIQIETEIEKHDKEIEVFTNQALIKTKIERNLTLEQQKSLDDFVKKMHNSTYELNLKKENKKNDLKVKMRVLSNYSEIEVEKEIQRIENITGLTRLKSERALEKIEDARKEINEVKKLLNESFIVNITDLKGALVLIDQSERHLKNAELAFNESKYGEAFGQATAAENIVRNAKSFSEILPEAGKEKIDIEAQIGKEITKVKVDFNQTKTRLVLNTTNKTEIVNQISIATGLNPADVEKIIQIEKEKLSR